MSSTIPENYHPFLELYETQKAIGLLKRVFADQLGGALNLRRVTAPLFVEAGTGLNDDLNGVERAVAFDIPGAGKNAQVVHSLAKWKRMALYRFGFPEGSGLYTDMNAIRRDEELDNLHSCYVDQWDWERVISLSDRTNEFLEQTVRTIVKCVCETAATMRNIYPELNAIPELSPDVTFVTTQELEDLYPDLTPKERENTFVMEHKTTFIKQIGGKLKSGKPHDGRAPDYDDWSLNGDILFWNPILNCAFELSSMGIRVTPEVLHRQLEIAGCPERENFPFHRALLAGELPYTIGGGIGQSRLCMLLLGKAHIGEVQSSVWDEHTRNICDAHNVPLL